VSAPGDRRSAVASGLAIALLFAAVVALQATRERLAAGIMPQEISAHLLYVRSPQVLSRAALSYRSLVADAYWIRTIQHYGGTKLSKDPNKQYDLLFPLLDLTTSLDPHFNTAYRFGAIFLAEPPPAGPGRPDQAIALLQKGLQAQPDRWEFAEDIGFVYYWWQRDYAKAADWFRRAADMPNAPNWMAGLAAVTLAQGGNRASSRVLWQEMLRNAEAEWIAAQARFRLAQLDALDQIEALERVVTTYTQRTGAPPRDWTDVIRAGLLRGIPVDPERHPYLLAPQRGRVELDPTSPLNPLPVPEQSDPSTSLGTSPSTSLGTGR
jgi:tetratricopeptide (TPR) repeat protein